MSPRLKQAVESGAARRDAAASGARRQDQGDRSRDRQRSARAGSGVSQAEIAAINEKIAGVEALAKAAGEASSTVDGRLGALEQSLSALSAKVDAQAAQPKIALAIAAAALKSAIERGAPFTAEIETFAAIAPDAPELPRCATIAEKGVATRADIAAETDAAANAMIAAASPPTRMPASSTGCWPAPNRW